MPSEHTDLRHQQSQIEKPSSNVHTAKAFYYRTVWAPKQAAAVSQETRRLSINNNDNCNHKTKKKKWRRRRRRSTSGNTSTVIDGVACCLWSSSHQSAVRVVCGIFPQTSWLGHTTYSTYMTIVRGQLRLAVSVPSNMHHNHM